MSKISMNKSNRKNNAALEEALSVIVDDRYSYNLYISRSLMVDYLHVCKKRKVSAATELTDYIKRQLIQYGQ